MNIKTEESFELIEGVFQINMLYINLNNFDKKINIGIRKKIEAQIKVLEKHFNIAYLSYLKNKGFYISLNNEETLLKCFSRSRLEYIKKRIFIYKSLMHFIDQENINVLYIRYPLSDPFFLHFLEECKRKRKTILLEIATYPYDKEMGKTKLMVDRYFRRYLKKYVDVVVTYSVDEVIFGIPTLRVLNGIDFNSIALRNQNNKNNNEINIIAVASFAFWHGYDRFIKGMGRYIETGGKRKIILHMVGDGNIIREYKELVSKYEISNSIVFYGFKSGKDLDDIYNKCDLGLATLAMHRVGINLESTLKTREYGAKGIPIITSCKVDYIPEGYKYLLNVPADESNIEIEKVITFYDAIYSKDANLDNIAQEIREFSRSRCDIEIVMQPVIDYISKYSY